MPSNTLKEIQQERKTLSEKDLFLVDTICNLPAIIDGVRKMHPLNPLERKSIAWNECIDVVQKRVHKYLVEAVSAMEKKSKQ